MVMPAAASISVSASTKGSLSLRAMRRPMVDLPTPIMPTSTIERAPSADRMSASGEAWIGNAASDMDSLNLPPKAAPFGHLYDPKGGLARGLLPRNGEHVG